MFLKILNNLFIEYICLQTRFKNFKIILTSYNKNGIPDEMASAIISDTINKC